MSGIPTWPIITGALGSTTTAFGASDWANLISQYFNGTNIALLDASKAPLIGTLTRYVFEKLSLLDTDSTHSVVLSVDDIDTGPTRKIRIRRMNTPYEEDFAVLEQLGQTLINKSINSDNNTITNIKNADIKAAAAIAYSKLNLAGNILNTDINSSAAIAYSKLNLSNSILNADINSSAAIAWTKISKTGSVLGDMADTVITTPAQYNILIRNGSSQWINLAKGSNSTALTVDASGVLAYTTITNAMLAGSIAYSKLSLGTSIVNADISTSASIAYSKLNLATSIVNADVSASAAIAYSKLNLATSILNADVNVSAAIATTKLADSANFILKTLDNSFGAHYQDVTKMTAPGNPGANDIRLYVDTSDTHLKIKNNAGTVVDLHATGGSGEVNTLGSVGSGTGTLPATKSGTVLNMKSLLAGTNITLTNNTNDVTIAATGSGGAPTTAQYVTLATDATLTVERVLTSGTNIAFVDGGAGSTLTVNVPDATTSVKGAAELATDGEVAANVVVQGNDSRIVRDWYEEQKSSDWQYGEYDIKDGNWGSGLFIGYVTPLGADGYSASDTADGFYRFYTTAATTGSKAGRSLTATIIRKWNPKFYFVFKMFDTANHACFLGHASTSDATSVHATNPLASMHGIGLAVTTDKANFQIVHNAAAGSPTFLNTSVAKDTTPRWFEVYTDDTNWYAQLEGDSNGLRTITTNMPAQTQGLNPQWFDLTNTTAAKNLYIYKIIHKYKIP